MEVEIPMRWREKKKRREKVASVCARSCCEGINNQGKKRAKPLQSIAMGSSARPRDFLGDFKATAAPCGEMFSTNEEQGSRAGLILPGQLPTLSPVPGPINLTRKLPGKAPICSRSIAIRNRGG
jgi:hypothetical protein